MRALFSKLVNLVKEILGTQRETHTYREREREGGRGEGGERERERVDRTPQILQYSLESSDSD